MRRRDVRLAAFALVLAAVALGGFAFGPRADDEGTQFDARFHEAVRLLQAREHAKAARALHRLLEIAPQLPELHVNMGYAQLGLDRPGAARQAFESALNLRPHQANAYYGLAESLEALGDLPGALGAMRTYVHLSPPDDPFVRKASAAIWEWEGR